MVLQKRGEIALLVFPINVCMEKITELNFICSYRREQMEIGRMKTGEAVIG